MYRQCCNSAADSTHTPFSSRPLKGYSIIGVKDVSAGAVAEGLG